MFNPGVIWRSLAFSAVLMQVMAAHGEGESATPGPAERGRALGANLRAYARTLDSDDQGRAVAELRQAMLAAADRLAPAAGLPGGSGPPPPSRSALIMMVFHQARQLAGPDHEGKDSDLELAAMLLDIAVALAPENRDLVYQAAITRQSIPWACRWPSVPPAGGSIAAGKITPPLPAEAAAPEDPAIRRQSKVHGLVVLSREDDTLGGFRSELIATQAIGRHSGEPRAAFTIDVSNDMRLSLDEARRLAVLRYPETGGRDIRISFDDKFGRYAGPSAGTAFAVLLMSLLGDFEIDPGAAITGDITVDGKIRRVGGVDHKVRGAALAGATIVGVPSANESAVASLAVLGDWQVLVRTQVFSLETIDQALAIARQEKQGDIGQAIALFGEVQKWMMKDGKIQTATPEVRAGLDEVLRLAPNHLSAKFLRAAADGQAPSQLDIADSADKILEALGPLTPALVTRASSDSMLISDGYGGALIVPKPMYTFPREIFDSVLGRLDQLEAKIAPKARPLHAATKELVENMRWFVSQYKVIPHRSRYGGYIQEYEVDRPRVAHIKTLIANFQKLAQTVEELTKEREYLEATRK